jgi:UMP-CMP kinase
MLACGDAPGFLIDGFPRNQDNLDGWEREMSTKVKVHFILNLVAPIEICTQRCLSRGENRPDDNTETLKKRFIMHQQITQPIVDHFRQLGLLYEIDTRDTPEQVFSQISSLFRRPIGFRKNSMLF